MKKLNVIILFLMLLPAIAFAQDGEPVVVLEYFDNPDGVFITSADGEEFFPEFGMFLEPGDKLETTDAVAEIRLDPNGSLIKLASNTEFIIDTLQNKSGAEANTFSLLSGKLKAIAARTTDSKYQIKTVSAVCGVRGTIFGLEVIPGLKDAVIVEKGKISFLKNGTGESIDIGAGQFADTFAAAFAPVAVSAEQIADFFQGIQDFVGENINPQEVPGNEPGADDGTTDGAEGEGDGEAEETTEEETADATPVTPEATDTAEAEPEEPAEPGPLDPIMEYLQDVLGMEIGSITIDGNTYSKAVIQPEFTLGKMKLGLYLPIIYQSNMFDPADWYRPKGNDEWSFGADQDWEGDLMGSLGDLFGDIFLKIKYLEYGEQRDKFFVKIGNLDNMTIGHGLLMRNYANDANFPAIRRIGLNTGFDWGGIGIEAMVNDFTEPEIFGARIYLRPSPENFPMAFGLSGIVDIDPAGEIAVDPADTSGIDPAVAVGDPMFINASFDIDLPIVNNEFLQIIMFGDIGGMMPYYRLPITDGTTTIQEGLLIEALIDADAGPDDFPLRNYGFAAGLLGKIFIADYRLEYRNYRGTFKPAFYGPNYDRIRGDYAVELYNEVFTPQEVKTIAGIYGEAGFTITDKFRFEAGYMWPWESDFTFGDDDYIHLEAQLFSGLIPVIDISGSIAYDRTQFIPALINKETTGPKLFDANTVLRGELIYPIAPTLDIAILITTTTAHNDDGEVLLDADGNTKISPSVSIETRIHF